MVSSILTKWRPGRFQPRHAEAIYRFRALGAGVVAIGLAGMITISAFLPGPQPEETPAGPRTLVELRAALSRSGLDLPALKAGAIAVPRLKIDRLPRDWRADTRADRRKEAFIAVVLPLVLRANEKILDDRRRLLHDLDRLHGGHMLTAEEGAWLRALAVNYEVEPASLSRARGGIALLLRRVDAVPPSLAIAQAAMESGWGSSRFAIAGNALFGEWTEETENAMVPAARDPGRTYAIRRFPTLQASIDSYMRNLNTHRAYRTFRKARATSRAKGEAVLGLALVPLLRAYSAQGPKYIKAIQSIIAKNDLEAFDRVELAELTPDTAG